ncbi:Dpy-30 motif protein [Besnoitia besnoiti]|uniref:Dpy-30 motif protein n=1 Tax=Besnoitia besnoiti TaxID=94643 RepID=A0A2A9MDI2_BESBE|nr:Dpy-30 motif protein [Besnoitia besnoiti]PFH36055.1 Dpy-30 motif protein [Besnoitia besnoiti]
MRASLFSAAPETATSTSAHSEGAAGEKRDDTEVRKTDVAEPVSLDAPATGLCERHLAEVDHVPFGDRRPRLSAQSLPVRQYLDLMVVPALLPALTVLVNERPEQPVEFLAHWLLENGPKYASRDNGSSADAAAALSVLVGRGS